MLSVVDELPNFAGEDSDPRATPDEQLALMFVCAYPAIDAGVHTLLMLQTVLGFEAADTGRPFLTSPAALAQRLVRAKSTIHDSGIVFAVSGRTQRNGRLRAALEALKGL